MQLTVQQVKHKACGKKSFQIENHKTIYTSINMLLQEYSIPQCRKLANNIIQQLGPMFNLAEM
jgi:hypothetical protein